MILGVALLGELQEIGASQVGERGSELRILRDDLLEQRNRRFERLRPVVVRQQLVRAPVVLLLSGHRRRRDPACVERGAPARERPATAPRRRRPARASRTAKRARFRGAAVQRAADASPIASDSAAIICPVLAKRFPGDALMRRFDDARERFREIGTQVEQRATFAGRVRRAQLREIRALDRISLRQEIEQQRRRSRRFRSRSSAGSPSISSGAM